MRTSLLAATLLAPCLAPLASAQFVTWEDATSLGFDDLAISPDGRHLVLRDGSFLGSTFVVDLTTGALVFTYTAPMTTNYTVGAPCVDAVEATDTRAVSLATTCALIDLTGAAPSLLAEYDLGQTPRDLALTPDGRFALVRGGNAPAGGVHVIDLQTGALLVDRSADVQPFLETGNDLCDADDMHGVALSYDAVADATHVHVVDFAAPGGPAIVFESIGLPGLFGSPMDVDLAPSGLWAAVRSEREMAILRLDGVNSGFEQRTSVFATAIDSPLNVQFDSVLMTDELLVTASPVSPLNSGSIVELMDVSGTRWNVPGLGLTHDLAVTPDGTRLLVNGEFGLDLIDLAARPVGGGVFGPAVSAPIGAAERGLLAGLDSVDCTNELCAILVPTAAGTRVLAFALSDAGANALVTIFDEDLDGRPLDVVVAPDGSFAAWVAQREYVVADLRTGSERLREAIAPFAGLGSGWPWGDAATIHPKQLGLGGVRAINVTVGWARSVDLVSRAEVVCQPSANGAGLLGETFALGSTRVASGDLVLGARNVTPGLFGVFRYGDAFNQTTLGGALVCVGGATAQLDVVTTSPSGQVEQSLDLGTAGAPGAGFLPGTTWYVQFIHRDTTPGGVGAASALSLLLQ